MTALRGRTAAAALALLGVATLAGCGAGRDAQTYQERRQADSTTVGVGDLVLSNVAVRPPEDSDEYEVGEDAEARVFITNRASEEDRLVSVTTPAAQKVTILDEGEGGASGGTDAPGVVQERAEVTLLLEGLKQPLRTGEFITMSFRFERNGTVEALVPIALTGRTDRPVYTKEDGSEEGEPALQGPTGGHGEEPHE